MNGKVRIGSISVLAAATILCGVVTAGVSKPALAGEGCLNGQGCTISSPSGHSIEGRCGIPIWLTTACGCGAGSSPENFIFQWNQDCWGNT